MMCAAGLQAEIQALTKRVESLWVQILKLVQIQRFPRERLLFRRRRGYGRDLLGWRCCFAFVHLI